MGSSAAHGTLGGFESSDGTWCDNPKIKIDSFEVRVEGDEIQVRVPLKEPPSAV